MLEKLLRPIVNAIDRHRDVMISHSREVDLLTRRVIALESILDAGLATLIHTQVAMMTGTEKSRFDAYINPIKIQLPPVKGKPL